MTKRYDRDLARRRVLCSCVRLIMEKGYTRTRMAEIVRAANVSISSFQNLFGSKDGVLAELVRMMFGNQFGTSRALLGADADPVLLYAVETSMQLMLTERNENIRDIYLEAYSHAEISEYIYRQTAAELMSIFSPYLPGCGVQDFYELEIGSAGIMRNYMARVCGEDFPLSRKLERFLTMSLRAYAVPEQKREEIVAAVGEMDIEALSERALQNLFSALEMQFDFRRDGGTEA